jgi:hypothetical protein
MARQAGFSTGTRDWADGNGGFKYAAPLATGNCLVELEAFAKLVSAKEQKKWEDQTAVEIHEAVLEEREACAKVCEDDINSFNGAYYLANKIRARGEA